MDKVNSILKELGKRLDGLDDGLKVDILMPGETPPDSVREPLNNKQNHILIIIEGV